MDYTLNCNGRIVSLATPQVMGVVNVTPDSFYAASRLQSEDDVARRVRQIVSEGGTMVDVGACSTRPDSEPVTQQEEMQRLRWALPVVRREAGEAVVSVDTFRPDVARMAVEEYGVDIINDVRTSAKTRQQGDDGPCSVPVGKMGGVVARLGVPYILMSCQPTMPDILLDFARDVDLLRSQGQKDIILDPGFGFGKTLEQNYEVMQRLELLQTLELPVLVGVSRKSMIYRLLHTDADHALNGTTVLHTVALLKGAAILRVHDVREAVECLRIVRPLQSPDRGNA